MYRLTALLAAAALLSFAACEDEAALADPAYDSLLEASADEAIEALFLSPAELEAAYDEHPGRRRQRFSGQCFSLAYPVSVDFPGDGPTSVADSAALKAALRAWASERTGRRRARPALVYPVTVVTADGTPEEIASRREMRTALRACGDAREPCVAIVYPVEVTLGGEAVTAADADELRAAVRAYRLERRRGPRPALVYPVTVEYADGTTAEVGGREAWREVRATCRAAREDCFSFVFPLTVVNADGETREVDSAEALRVARSHAGRGGRHRIERPFDVTTADGATVTIAAPGELRALWRACR